MAIAAAPNAFTQALIFADLGDNDPHSGSSESRGFSRSSEGRPGA